MSKNLTRKISLVQGDTWTAPAGVSVIRASVVGKLLPKIAISNGHSMLLDIGGATYAWGTATQGQLGDNTILPKSTPVLVLGGQTFHQIAGGGAFSLGINSVGDCYAWGQNTSGQLGNNTATLSSTPVLVLGGLKFVQVAAGDTHSMGITVAGDLYAWGSNTNGRLGDNTTAAKSTPGLVAGGLKWKKIAGGTVNSAGITTSGDAYCWGRASLGQIGDNQLASQRSTPSAVVGGLKFIDIAVGNEIVGAITEAGAAYAWGANYSGALGINEVDPLATAPRSTPVAVLGGLVFSQINLLDNSMTALTTSGLLYAWGSNTEGQLGDNTINDRSTPVAVQGVGGSIFAALAKGSNNSQFNLALKNDGTQMAWGVNTAGRLGDNTTTSRSTPVAVLGGRYVSPIKSQVMSDQILTVVPGTSYTFAYASPFVKLGDTVLGTINANFVVENITLEYFS